MSIEIWREWFSKYSETFNKLFIIKRFL